MPTFTTAIGLATHTTHDKLEDAEAESAASATAKPMQARLLVAFLILAHTEYALSLPTLLGWIEPMDSVLLLVLTAAALSVTASAVLGVALWSSLGSSTLVLRVAAGATAMVGLELIYAAGSYAIAGTRLRVTFMLVLYWLWLQVPAWLLRAVRGWRISTQTATARIDTLSGRRHFTLRRLLGVATAISILMASLRLVSTDGRDGSSDWLGALVGLQMVSLAGAISLGLTVFALGNRRRVAGLVASICLVVCLMAAVEWFMPDGRMPADSFFVATTLALLATLFAFRWCGYRLVRQQG